MSVDSRDVYFSRRRFTQLFGTAAALTLLDGTTAAVRAAPVEAELRLSVRSLAGGISYNVEAACATEGRAAIKSVQIFVPALARPEVARLVLRSGQSTLRHEGSIPAGEGHSVMAVATLADGSHIIQRKPIVPAI